jgi:type IV pilus assembly protein PilY1
VINYGGTTGVVVFYGANDGMFRAINGNQPNNPTDSSKPKGHCTVSSTCALTMRDATGATTSIPPGGELWSFVPSEFYPGLQRLYENSPTLKLGTLTTGSAKNYFFDGAPSVYQNSATGKAYIFLSARRGGRLLYALDVSDPTNPKFMWKRSNADTGFAELGQTWSQPKVAMIKGHANPVLIFGAGYDTNEDVEPPNADTMGRGIFIVDAVTGNVLWQAGPGGAGSSCTGNPCKLAEMTYSIPADVTLVDRDFDGLIDRLYAADTGGNIWRVDLQPTGSGDMSTWQATHFAALGGSATNATKRKFFFPPDVVLTKTYDVVLDITGDREHPLQTHKATGIVNRFYMIKDTKVGMSASGWTPVRDATSSILDDAPATLFRATNTIPYDGSLNGFYVTLAGAGEKGVNAPTTVGGLVYFGTNQPIVPSSTTCQANLGTARSYSVNFLTGASSFRVLDGGGLAPSPVFGIVTVNVGGTDRQLPFLIGGGGGSGADGKSGLGAQKPVIPIKNIRKRTYWYRETDAR